MGADAPAKALPPAHTRQQRRSAFQTSESPRTSAIDIDGMPFSASVCLIKSETTAFGPLGIESSGLRQSGGTGQNEQNQRAELAKVSMRHW